MIPEYMQNEEKDWYSSYNRSRIDLIERMLIDNAEEVECLVETEDPNANYSFDNWCLLKYKDIFYVVNTSGCSCPSPREVWYIAYSGSKDEVESDLITKAKGWLTSGEKEFLIEVKKLGWNIPEVVQDKRYDW